MADTETRRAPRVPPAPTSLAAAAAKSSQGPNVEQVEGAARVLSEWRLDGVTPFGTEASDGIIRNAAGLATLLEYAFDSADDDAESRLASLRDSYTAKAFGAIADLMNFATFLKEAGQ